jgi:hypothetical protein
MVSVSRRQLGAAEVSSVAGRISWRCRSRKGAGSGTRQVAPTGRGFLRGGRPGARPSSVSTSATEILARVQRLAKHEQRSAVRGSDTISDLGSRVPSALVCGVDQIRMGLAPPNQSDSHRWQKLQFNVPEYPPHPSVQRCVLVDRHFVLIKNRQIFRRRSAKRDWTPGTPLSSGGALVDPLVPMVSRRALLL